MNNRPLFAFALSALSFGAAAHAGPRRPNLSASISAPSGVSYGANARYTVNVANVGNATASTATLTIQLPQTHTSPTVHILGDLGSRDGRCSVSGTTLVCALTNLRANRSTAVWFDLAIPYSSAPVDLSAAVSTSSDSDASNDRDAATLSLTAVNVAVNAPRQTLVRHCTGTNLTSFFECELYPSSITEHETVLHANGTLDFLGEAAGIYFGTWSQPAPNRLQMTYTDNGNAVATFDGYGIDGCFEGRTTFPNSNYVSMYQVCLR